MYATRGFTLALASCWLSTVCADADWMWAAAPGGIYNVANNWLDRPTQSIHGVPGAFDSAIHWGHAASYTVSSSANADVGSLSVQANQGVADRATYDFNGRTLTANGGSAHDRYGIEIANDAGAAQLALLDGVYQANALRVTSTTASSATARLTVGAGARLTTGAIASPLGDNVGSSAASAMLAIESGGIFESLGLQVGGATLQRGAVQISGAGSLLEAINPAAMQVAQARGIGLGRHGEGELSLSGNALARTQQFSVGGASDATSATGVGRLNVDHAQFEVQAIQDNETGQRTSFDIGLAGQGSVNLTNQAQFMTTARIDAGGLSSGGFGAGSAGTIEARGGSDLTTREVRLGRDVGCVGSMVLDGPGTTLVDNYGGQVGYRGTGSLSITGGATARFAPSPDVSGTGIVNLARLGSASSGTVLVSGVGSSLTIEGPNASLAVGREGHGMLTVSTGAVVETTDGDVVIGRVAGAVGEAVVSGAGSVLRSATTIDVGGWTLTTLASGAAASGQASLTLSQGGAIEARAMRVFAGDTVTFTSGGFGTLSASGGAVNTPNTLTVGAGGELSGQGAIVGRVRVASGGRLDPRAAGSTVMADLPSEFTVTGDLQLESGSTVEARIDRAGVAGADYDTLHVTGAATIGGVLDLHVAGDYTPSGGDEFDLIAGSDTIDGAFATILGRELIAASGGQGAIVWGDYRQDLPSVGADRYYLAPRRQADFNGFGGVTGADFTIWADHFGRPSATFGEGDANGDRQVTGADFTLWADGFGDTSLAHTSAVPEPAASVLAALAFVGLLAALGRPRQRNRPRLGRGRYGSIN